MIDCYKFKCSDCDDVLELYQVMDFNPRNLLTERKKVCVAYQQLDWLMVDDIGFYYTPAERRWSRMPIMQGISSSMLPM